MIRKGFGRRAGLAAVAIALGTFGALLLLLQLRGVPQTLPAMTPLGPLMVLQYAYWRRRRGPERTTQAYLRAEPVRGAAPLIAR